MDLPDDLWKEIKQFLFNKHLWTNPENINFNKVVCEIPKMSQITTYSSEDYCILSPLKIICQSNVVDWKTYILIKSYYNLKHFPFNE